MKIINKFKVDETLLLTSRLRDDGFYNTYALAHKHDLYILQTANIPFILKDNKAVRLSADTYATVHKIESNYVDIYYEWSNIIDTKEWG
jgi:hypothetical protein